MRVSVSVSVSVPVPGSRFSLSALSSQSAVRARLQDKKQKQVIWSIGHHRADGAITPFASSVCELRSGEWAVTGLIELR